MVQREAMQRTGSLAVAGERVQSTTTRGRHETIRVAFTRTRLPERKLFLFPSSLEKRTYLAPEDSAS